MICCNECWPWDPLSRSPQRALGYSHYAHYDQTYPATQAQWQWALGLRWGWGNLCWCPMGMHYLGYECMRRTIKVVLDFEQRQIILVLALVAWIPCLSSPRTASASSWHRPHTS